MGITMHCRLRPKVSSCSSTNDKLEKFGDNGELGDFVSLDDAFIFRLGELAPPAFGGAITSGG
jgi:hypothetical protein